MDFVKADICTSCGFTILLDVSLHVQTRHTAASYCGQVSQVFAVVVVSEANTKYQSSSNTIKGKLNVIQWIMKDTNIVFKKFYWNSRLHDSVILCSWAYSLCFLLKTLANIDFPFDVTQVNTVWEVDGVFEKRDIAGLPVLEPASAVEAEHLIRITWRKPRNDIAKIDK